MRIEEFDDNSLRIVYNDDGKILKLIDRQGNTVLQPVGSETNPLTKRIGSLTAGSEVISPYADFTWAGKPLATAWPVGVPIMITDVGNSAAGSQWVTDGTNWRPANGRVSLASRSGSVATPISTISAATFGKFTLPENIKIPAGCIVHGQTTLEVVVTLRRRGTAATNQFIVYVGSTNSTSDSASIAVTTTATNNQDCNMYPVIGFPSSGTMLTSTWSGIANTTSGADNADRTTNINTAVDMFVNFGVFSGNAADSYDLLAYRVALVF